VSDSPSFNKGAQGEAEKKESQGFSGTDVTTIFTGGSTMAIAMILELPGVTQQQYETAGAELGDPRKQGALVHIAGPTEGGWRVVEVWPSQEVAQAFFGAETTHQAFQKAGIPPVQPTVFPVHVLVTP
jgi:hypothetical protein